MLCYYFFVSAVGPVKMKPPQYPLKTTITSRKPTVPLRKPSVPLPKRLNKTWTTTAIHHPFEVNKIEPLHGQTTRKGILLF